MDNWLAQLLATDAPALPSSAVLQFGLHMGWGIVLAWLGALVMRRLLPPQNRMDARHATVAGLIGLSAWLPGAYSPAYWLGLAFQLPSMVSVCLCAGLLIHQFMPLRRVQSAIPASDRLVLALAVMGTVTGWALLLDTFAVLPVQLYGWGFSPAAAGCVALAVWVPWVVWGAGKRSARLGAWAAPVALVVFVVWRLPTGNVWDAVLDPWIWIALQVYLLRRLRKRSL